MGTLRFVLLHLTALTVAIASALLRPIVFAYRVTRRILACFVNLIDRILDIAVSVNVFQFRKQASESEQTQDELHLQRIRHFLHAELLSAQSSKHLKTAVLVGRALDVIDEADEAKGSDFRRSDVIL